MDYQIIRPSAFLMPFVKYYWYLEMEAEQAVRHLQRIVPNGCMEIVFHFGCRLQRLGAEKGMQPRSLVCGQKNGFF